jgi:hypothetical protein
MPHQHTHVHPSRDSTAHHSTPQHTTAHHSTPHQECESATALAHAPAWCLPHLAGRVASKLVCLAAPDQDTPIARAQVTPLTHATAHIKSVATCVLQALQEAAKHLGRSTSTDREAQVAALQESCERMSRFVQAQACLVQDPATAVAICQQLLQEAPEHVVSACAQQ